jgi:hypothetical protein
MNKKLFGRDGRQARLQNLYRAAERDGDLRAVDPELQQEFTADQQIMQQLGRLADRSAPVNPAIGRATLLSAVVQKQNQSSEKEPGSMIGQLLTGKGLALLAAAGIFAGGAATVGASGGVSGAASNANSVLSALHITHNTDGPGHGNSGDATAEASRTPDASHTPEAEGTKRAVQGIPTDNPNHQPEATPGVCNKGETIVKTTPSGEQVTVPCQTGEDHGSGNSNSHADKTPPADETPEANATETPRALPTQANPHATEGAGNAPAH